MTTSYLFLESRDLLAAPDADSDFDLATGLARAGHEVRVFLVQNGVHAARRSAELRGLRAALDSGVRVLVDELSLRVRGIASERLEEGVTVAPIDVVVDGLARGDRAVWL